MVYLAVNAPAGMAPYSVMTCTMRVGERVAIGDTSPSMHTWLATRSRPVQIVSDVLHPVLFANLRCISTSSKLQ